MSKRLRINVWRVVSALVIVGPPIALATTDATSTMTVIVSFVWGFITMTMAQSVKPR